MTENTIKITGNAYLYRGKDNVTNQEMIDLCWNYLNMYKKDQWSENLRSIIWLQMAKYGGRRSTAKAPTSLIKETTAVLDTLDHLRSFDLLKEQRDHA